VEYRALGPLEVLDGSGHKLPLGGARQQTVLASLLLRAGQTVSVIWRLVKRVAARAGVDAHVHALRGAFAAYYLSLHPGDVEALKELLGHRSIATTQVYLRKFDKATAMERARSLSWDDVAKNGDGAATESSQSAAKTFESLAGVGAGGFEPP
jgi:integrase